MPKPKVHFLVCSNQRPQGHPRGCCAEKGSMDVLTALSGRLQETEKFDVAMLSMVQSCLGPCSLGPIVIVYPDNVWYGQMDAEKAKQVFDSHVNDGKPVESLVLQDGAF